MRRRFRFRNDISYDLIHFTKDNDRTLEGSFQNLLSILNLGDGRLNPGTGMIRGAYPCICFTEAPLDAVREGFAANLRHQMRYAPFGIVFHKGYIFQLGGRPVIYSTDWDYQFLSECFRWRFVLYEPPSVDFSWEREWRLFCPDSSPLWFSPDQVRVVVPDEYWHDRLCEDLYCNNVPEDLWDVTYLYS